MKRSCVIGALEFHPALDILLTGGMDKRVRLYNVSGNESKKLSSVYLRDLPITAAHFILQGNQVIAGGNKKHFYYFDLNKIQPYKVANIVGAPVEQFGRSIAVSPDQSAFASLDKSGYHLYPILTLP